MRDLMNVARNGRKKITWGSQQGWTDESLEEASKTVSASSLMDGSAIVEVEA